MQPPEFTPSRDYSDDSANNVSGRATVLPASLDTDFTNIKAFVDAVRTNIALIQRDDGELRDGMVKTHTLSGDIAAYLANQIGVLNASTNLITGTDSGAADAYVVTPSETITSYPTYLTVWWKALNANTGASTLQVGTGPVGAIKKDVSLALGASDIAVNKMMLCIWDGTNWQLVNPFLAIGSHTADTANPHAVTKAQVGLSAVSNALQLVAASNLSDLGNAATARANLGVQTAVDLATNAWKVLSKIAAYTVVAADARKLIECDATAGIFTIGLTAAATLADGFMICVKKIDSSANAITVDAAGSETIDGSLTNILTSQYDSVILVCDGGNWHVVAEKKSTSSTDEKAGVSAADTAPGYLEDKILQGTGITITKANPGADETLTISSNLSHVKVVNATRDMTAASGTQAITGAGGTPIAVRVIASLNGGWNASVGHSDGVTDYCIAVTTTSSQWNPRAELIHLEESSGLSQNAVLTSFDSDGCTLTWTKVSIPTGIADLSFEFLI